MVRLHFVVFVCSALIWECYNGFCFCTRNKVPRRNPGLRAESSKPLSDVTLSVENDINGIVDLCLRADASPGGLPSISPSVLTLNAAYLAKGRLYEKVVKKRLEEAVKSEESARLERVDSFLHGFVQSERKKRARLKVNYIMAGATTGRLEESIEMLYEADEIDETLLLYINGLINTQLSRSPAVEFPGKEVLEGGSGENSIAILKLIYRRLEAQVKTVNAKKELLLLAKLVGEKDPQRRVDILKKQLTKVEDMETFVLFVADGIEHLTKSSSQDNQVSIERMKDLLVDAKSMLNPLLSSNDLFSTSTDPLNVPPELR